MKLCEQLGVKEITFEQGADIPDTWRAYLADKSDIVLKDEVVQP